MPSPTITFGALASGLGTLPANKRYLMSLVTGATTRQTQWIEWPVGTIIQQDDVGGVQVLSMSGNLLPMSSMTSPVKTTIDAITAQGGPAWVSTLPSGSDFANEISLRAGADSTNASAIVTEITDRGAAIMSEAATRTVAISTEQGARVAADTTLMNALATEVSIRQSAVASLASQLTTDEATATALLAAVTAITPHKASATIDFGYAAGNGEGDIATTTVSAAWVTSTSRIICHCSPLDSLDHTVDETIAEGITFEAINIVPGTSFDVKAFAPTGTWGRHDCSILAL